MKVREFKKPNMSNGFECPICKSSADKPVVLVPIPGTQDGNIQEAKQVHSKCFELYCEMNEIKLTSKGSI